MLPEIRGLTLTRPWGQFIAAGFKTLESRTWRYLPEYRGLILLTSAKSWDDGWSDAVRLTRPELMRNARFRRVADMAQANPESHILGVCKMIDARAMVKADEFQTLYPISEGRKVFQFDDYRASCCGKPISGSLGLWRPDTQLLQSIGYPWDFPRTPAMSHTPRP